CRRRSRGAAAVAVARVALGTGVAVAAGVPSGGVRVRAVTARTHVERALVRVGGAGGSVGLLRGHCTAGDWIGRGIVHIGDTGAGPATALRAHARDDGVEAAGLRGTPVDRAVEAVVALSDGVDAADVRIAEIVGAGVVVVA